MQFIVEGMYSVPEWFEWEGEAEDETDAEDQAMSYIMRSAPEEAVDFEVIDVREING
jgi:hypothetical protein